MSHFSILREATLALRNTLFAALSDTQDVDFTFDNMATDIILSPPRRNIPNTAQLSIYLYHIEADPQMRNQPKLSQGRDALLRAPQAVRAFYLITPLLTDEDQNHLMMGRILQTMHDRPFLTDTTAGPLDDSFGGGSPALRLSLEPMRLEDISRIWYALGADYRLSVAYMMRSVIIDSATAPTDPSRVETSHIVLRQGVGG
ncbi:DUF4255 domain-containing protein [Thalassococcus sp. BH17M4-6]|uniref:DUF4255 domain-containing protein n=1 Tax=Thalassococcus sp. BH17M4-6 TaxID=3413148 RepID=UPI003BF5E113